MLIRIWKTEFDVTRREELERFANEISAPMLTGLDGCLGYVFAFSGSTWITHTLWDSAESIQAAEASPQYQDTLGRILETGLLGETQSTEVFEVRGLSLEAVEP